MRLVCVSALAAVAVGLLLGCGGAYAASAEKGKAAFIQHGCWQCHGFQGQGGIAGLKLAPDPIAFEAFVAFVRGSNRFMPPYQETILSERRSRRYLRLSAVDPEAGRLQGHSFAQPVDGRRTTEDG